MDIFVIVLDELIVERLTTVVLYCQWGDVIVLTENVIQQSEFKSYAFSHSSIIRNQES